MTQRTLDTGLNELKSELVQMAGLLEEAIKCATSAWKNLSREMIEKVNEIETQVNRAHMEVDASCLKLLATQQPMASDLRYIISIVKMNTDIERMADQAVNIANNSEYYLKHPPYSDLLDLTKMSEMVRELVRRSIEAFVHSNAQEAQQVLDEDDQVDKLKDKIFRDVLEHVKSKPAQVEQGLNVILIARNLERIGDHATNIAEDVIFTVSGKDVRHGHTRDRKAKE